MARKKRRGLSAVDAALDITRTGVVLGVGGLAVGSVAGASPSARVPSGTVLSGLGLTSVAVIPRAGGAVIGSLRGLEIKRKKRR